MLRGCLFSIVLYFSLATGYYFWLDRVFDRPESIYGAGVAALLMLCCIGALINARNAAREARLASAAETDLPRNDGELVAISGTIHPEGEPLSAPFSETKCVLCEYDVVSRDRVSRTNDQANVGVDFTGFMMNPCVVRTRRGMVRLLSFPSLDGIGESTCASYYDLLAAREFFATTEFEDMTGLKMVRAIGAIKEVWNDDDGLVRKHIRLSRKVDVGTLFPEELNEILERFAKFYPPKREDELLDDDEELDDEDESDDAEVAENSDEVPESDEARFYRLMPRLREKRVAVGQTVTVIGRYDAARGGIVPQRGTGEHYVRLLRGKADEALAHSQSKVWTNLVGALIALIVINGVVWGAMELAWRAPDEMKERQRDLFQAANSGDLARLEKLIWRGMDINARDEDGQTMLIATRDAALAKWLLDHGADPNLAAKNAETALMSAAKRGDLETVRQLIAAKVDLNVRRPDYNTTALMQADAAYHEDVARLLRSAGAFDEVVTAANGSSLPPDGGEPLALCTEYLEAIHASDAEKLRTLVSRQSKATFQDVDWKLWHDIRPTEIVGFEGYVKDNRCTLKLVGRTRGNFISKWNYQLEREERQWKVLREDWDTSELRK